MATQPRTLTALNKGQHLFEYDFPIVPIPKGAKEPNADDRAAWAAKGGQIRMVRLGSLEDHEERARAPKKLSKDEREELDRVHPPRSVKVSGEDWEALWASQKPSLQRAVQAGDIQVTTGDIDTLEG